MSLYPAMPLAVPQGLEALIEQSVKRFTNELPPLIRPWAEANGKIEAFRNEIIRVAIEARKIGRREVYDEHGTAS